MVILHNVGYTIYISTGECMRVITSAYPWRNLYFLKILAISVGDFAFALFSD